MRIATLQFSPRVGEVEANISQAESILNDAETRGDLDDLDLLVLPELAFSGYNFPSLAAITPFLEPTTAGVSTEWAIKTARRLGCVVAVGYPELSRSNDPVPLSSFHGEQVQVPSLDDVRSPFNSLVFVSAEGNIIAHHRKAFLYYSDDVWAKEGPDGFYHGALPLGENGVMVPVAAGICMDINPYKFEAPYTAYEFANHCLENKSQVVVVSMAWLTRNTHLETYGGEEPVSQGIRKLADMDTVGYWIERFTPLLTTSGSDNEVILVFANRAGEEGEAPIIGEVRYAGSSCVMGMTKASEGGEVNVKIWDMLGRGTNDLLIVNTDRPPLYRMQRKSSEQSVTDDDVERGSRGAGGANEE